MGSGVIDNRFGPNGVPQNRKLDNLEIGNVNTIKVFVKKIYFPRIRNLPNKVICEDDTGKIEIIYFNSREGYLRKIFPINKPITAKRFTFLGDKSEMRKIIAIPIGKTRRCFFIK